MSPAAQKAIKLSPSTLNLFLDCPRCFWLDKVKGIKRPRGIFPSLPSGMDREIKNHFDIYRSKKSLPPELSSSDFAGILLYDDQAQLERWRNWRTGLEYKDADGNILSGALDDLLVKDDLYIPFDYKTKGSPTTVEDAQKYYQNQLDCYALMLDSNGFKSAGFGFLLYYSPKLVTENGSVAFQTQPIKIETKVERAKATTARAINLMKGPIPAVNFNCEYCAWITKMRSTN